MEQTLTFHEAWLKTIAQTDKEHIEEIFEVNKRVNPNVINFVPIRVALNYKDEILATVLINNRTNKEAIFDQTPLIYLEGEIEVASHSFHVPVSLKANTSMPWTFIFPNDKQVMKPLLKDWSVLLK